MVEKEGADVKGKASPIRCAVSSGNIEIVKYLVSKGGKLEDICDDGSKPWNSLLYMAAEEGNLDLVNYLIEKGLDVNYNEGSFTALSGAVSNEHVDVVRTLLEHGANPNVKAKNGCAMRRVCKKIIMK